VEGSPTVVLPNGEQRSDEDLGLPKVELDESRHDRVVAFTPAICHGGDCLDLPRGLLDAALGGSEPYRGSSERTQTVVS